MCVCVCMCGVCVCVCRTYCFGGQASEGLVHAIELSHKHTWRSVVVQFGRILNAELNVHICVCA